MDTKKLRQKILDLAIRGKLVPQDPNDEPASVLLERIRAEKERLIAEGKIKRPKKTKSSSSESHYQNFTPPFSIPDSWEWVRLEDIIRVKSGESLNVRELQSKDRFPIYGGNGINGYYDKYNVEKDTIIIGRVGFYCGSIHKTKSESWVTDNALIVDSYPTNIDTDWLCLTLIWSNLRNTSNSTAQPVVSGKSIYPIYVPLPPKSEQHRIVNTFDVFINAIGIIEIGKNSIQDLIQLTKSKILDLAMQGKLVPQDPEDEPAADMLLRINPKAKIITDNPHYPQLPDNWVYLSIYDINTYKSSNITPASMPNQFFDLYSVPIFSSLMPENVKGCQIGSTKQVIKKGDILLCKINPHLNRIWEIIEKSDCVQIASSEWIVIRSKIHQSTFLKWYFSSPKFRTLLSSQVSGVGGSLTRAQPAIVKSYLVPVPPIEEQKRISQAIERWFDYLDNISLNLSN